LESVSPLERISHEPQGRRPEANEQGAPLGVAALVLIDRLRANPEHHAERDGPERQEPEMPTAQAGRREELVEHVAWIPLRELG
jgi:hypothetical protein